jgi:hypothetical protein
VFDNGHNDRREEILTEATALRVVSGETLVLETHEMMHQVAFGRPKEVARVRLVDDITVRRGITTSRNEWRGIRSECRDVGKRVASNAAHNTETLGEVGQDRACLERDRFVLPLRSESGDLLAMGINRINWNQKRTK